MKKILIDGRFIGVGDSISRYVLELTKNILLYDRENLYTLLVRPAGERLAQTCLGDVGNLKLIVRDIPHYSYAEQGALLTLLNQGNFDLVHFTQFNHPICYRGKFVTTIHDLTLIGHLHYFNFIKQLSYNLVMKDAIKRSKKVIAISNFTREDVIDFDKSARGKTSVVYHGIDHERYHLSVKDKTKDIARFKNAYDIAGDYMLYTGMWKKHKNLNRLFKAFFQYKKNSGNDIKLVLTGKIDQREPGVIDGIASVNNGLGSREIIATGFIEEKELPLAYAGARLYVIPSLSEGFGWPPLEAMACGTPVIASKESCIPEILGDAPLYFDPYDVDSIAEAIKIGLNDRETSQKIIKEGLEQVKKYNWSDTAKKTLEIYRSVL